VEARIINVKDNQHNFLCKGIQEFEPRLTD
jgi:hypothetical protein